MTLIITMTAISNYITLVNVPLHIADVVQFKLFLSKLIISGSNIFKKKLK